MERNFLKVPEPKKKEEKSSSLDQKKFDSRAKGSTVKRIKEHPERRRREQTKGKKDDGETLRRLIEKPMVPMQVLFSFLEALARKQPWHEHRAMDKSR